MVPDLACFALLLAHDHESVKRKEFFFHFVVGKDGQQKGTDLREKRKTCLPFSPSPFWKPFNGNTQSPWSGSFIFKMAAMLQIPRVFPRVSCHGSAKAVQCPCPGPKIGDKSQQIPRYSPVCPRGHPPGMAADKCITTLLTRQVTLVKSQTQQ